MLVMQTTENPLRTEADKGLPPTHINTETRWRDDSQIYGSNLQYQQRIRSGKDGKPIVPEDGVLAPNNESLVQQKNLAGWRVGLSLMFTLFAPERNAICDRLKTAYPHWSDDELFERARLIKTYCIRDKTNCQWLVELQ